MHDGNGDSTDHLVASETPFLHSIGISYPQFSKMGTVPDLPAELVPIETEASVRVLSVKFSDCKEAVLQLANVEMFEG